MVLGLLLIKLDCKRRHISSCHLSPPKGYFRRQGVARNVSAFTGYITLNKGQELFKSQSFTVLSVTIKQAQIAGVYFCRPGTQLKSTLFFTCLNINLNAYCLHEHGSIIVSLNSEKKCLKEEFQGFKSCYKIAIDHLLIIFQFVLKLS